MSLFFNRSTYFPSYFLFWLQSMLGSVITARDRWLKAGGLILPSHATVNTLFLLIFLCVYFKKEKMETDGFRCCTEKDRATLLCVTPANISTSLIPYCCL